MVSFAHARSPPILTVSSTSNVLPETSQLASVDNRAPAVADEMDDVMELDRGGADQNDVEDVKSVEHADREVVIDIAVDDSKVVVTPQFFIAHTLTLRSLLCRTLVPIPARNPGLHTYHLRFSNACFC